MPKEDIFRNKESILQGNGRVGANENMKRKEISIKHGLGPGTNLDINRETGWIYGVMSSDFLMIICQDCHENY